MHIDALYKLAQLIFTTIARGGYYCYSSFTDEKIVAQTGQLTCPKSASKWQNRCSNLTHLALETVLVTATWSVHFIYAF